MRISRKDIDDFARDVLGRRLSRAELDDLERRCLRIGLRQGDETFLLGLVEQRDLTTRLERVAQKAVENQSLDYAVHVLRHWIAGMAVLIIALGWGLYNVGHIDGYASRDRMVTRDLAWTATSAGLGARALYDTGVIPYLIACSFPGWVQVEQQCMPGVDPISRRMFGVTNRLQEAS